MNRYAQLSKDQLEEHFSNYLIDSWSYSAVSCFARNEKAFEMQYVYREKDSRSISSIAGNAYHAALKNYFCAWTDGLEPAVVNLTQWAYDYLDEVGANEWRLTDKFPTVEAAKAEATKNVNNLLESFCAEISTYTDQIARVIDVEEKYDVWVTVNGVDIPLPLHCAVDLVVELKDGRIVIIDHKSKSAFTDEKELALVHGQQAITYVKGWEEANQGHDVSEVWFIENKISKNKDKSAQMRKHVFTMDLDNRRLFEALLYEPLRRMLEAVANPDYIYTINPSDKFVDMAILYDFWARTQISEIEDFEYIPAAKKDLLAKRQRKIKDSSVGAIAPKVITNFRKNAASFITLDYAHSNMTNEEKIEHLLRTYNLQVKVAEKIEGFSCDTYLCEVAAGVELLSIFRHTLDIANALDVPRVRLQGEPLVMYKGKSYLAIEVNKKRTEDLPWDKKWLEGYRLPLGLDNFRNTVVWDLNNNTTPHVLVCGATGSGKSVCLTNILYYAIEAGVTDITILDPKFEFAFAQLPDNVRVLSDIADIDQALADMVVDMNERVKNRQKHFTLVIFDEFADAADQSDGTLIKNFKMLLQKGRSAGFRFVAATQRASVKTIPGDIKVNLPVQVCFRVPKGLDSKVVLDTEGAEALSGAGDGLIHSPEYNDGLVRFQAFYRPL
ncbi:MAG: PD-(D/E)XK nuclease family protein [Bacteroidales bacterium]|nr:PD-(D/E)XK nuclease family protein [Bacteroidales bacterium]